MEFDKLVRTMVQELSLSSALSGDPFLEKVQWRIKEGFNTACWCYANGIHSIYIGDQILNTPKAQSLTQEQQLLYVKAYGRHERDGHGKHTPRSSAEVAAILRPLPGTTRTIPFKLFNLFEDARVEYAGRNGVAGERFHWREFEAPPSLQEEPTLDPATVLFWLIQSEADHAALQDDWLTIARDTDMQLTSRVFEYYERIVAAPSAGDLRPLMLEWLAEFGESSGSGTSKEAVAGFATNGELAMGYALASNPAAKAAFEEGTVLVGDEPPVPLQGEAHSTKVSSDQERTVLQDESQASLNPSKVRALAKRLSRAFRSPTVLRESEDSTPYLCLDNLLLPDSRRAAWLDERAKGSARRYGVTLVVDCSGSMQGTPITEARYLIAALSELARQGLLEGEVLLTAVVGCTSIWERCAFPVSSAAIERIGAFAGGEGIEAALRQNVKTLAMRDRVFLYSDGKITDTPPDKAWLRARGVEVFGLYCGLASAAASLSSHTKKVIVRETPLALADALVKQLKVIR